MECLHDSEELRRFLARDPILHAYELGDLAQFFWPHTTWYGLRAGLSPEIRAVLLVYTGSRIPSLICFASDDDLPWAERLLKAALPVLPRTMTAQLSPGLLHGLTNDWEVRSRKPRLRMALRDRSGIDGVDTATATRLGPPDLHEILDLYERSYRDNWFDTRMLETGYYFGIRGDGKLRAVAGVHVVSPGTGVAALGNIATDPDWRGRGLARSVTARVCRELLADLDHIALNVGIENASAQAVYQRLGFEPVSRHDEVLLSSG